MASRESIPGGAELLDEYHPWDDADARHGEWVIRRIPMRGLFEVMCWRRKVILLEADRTKWERRSDLAHAIAHIDLEHHDPEDTKAELAASRLAAKRLIGRFRLAEAMIRTEGRLTFETAELLGVDLPMLLNRVTHLHPCERAFLQRKVSEGLLTLSA